MNSSQSRSKLLSKRENISMPVELRELLIKLEFISMCERGKKLNIKDFTFVDADSWMGSFKRFIKGEGRENTINEINNILDQAFTALQEYSDNNYCSLITRDLELSKRGLENIADTYKKYPKIVASVKVCISSVDLHLKKQSNHESGGYHNSGSKSNSSY